MDNMPTAKLIYVKFFIGIIPDSVMFLSTKKINTVLYQQRYITTNFTGPFKKHFLSLCGSQSRTLKFLLTLKLKACFRVHIIPTAALIPLGAKYRSADAANCREKLSQSQISSSHLPSFVLSYAINAPISLSLIKSKCLSPMYIQRREHRSSFLIMLRNVLGRFRLVAFFNRSNIYIESNRSI